MFYTYNFNWRIGFLEGNRFFIRKEKLYFIFPEKLTV